MSNHRVIENAEQLAAMQPWSIVIDACGDVCELFNGEPPHWITTGINGWDKHNDAVPNTPLLPARVLLESWER